MPPPGILASTALANLLTLPKQRVPPFAAMLWYAAREDTELHIFRDDGVKTPWWVDRIRFDCSADPTDNARRLKALHCNGSRQLRSLVMQEATHLNLDAISHWTALKHLGIVQRSTFGSVYGLQHLAGLVHLSSLNLSYYENLTDSVLQHLAGRV